jgi:GntR family transcriptional regulator
VDLAGAHASPYKPEEWCMAEHRPQTPKFEQAAEKIRARIKSGDLSPGDKLPMEDELAAKYEVARPTMRAALAVLEREGLIAAHRGKGFFVRSSHKIVRNETKRLLASVWGDGRSMWVQDIGTVPTPDELVVERRTAPAHVALKLGQTNTWSRDRGYRIGEQVVLLAASYVPEEIAEGTPFTQADTGPGGTYARLRDVGHAPVRFEVLVGSRMPTREESSRLGVSPSVPVLTELRAAFDAADRVVEVNEMVLDSTVFTLQFDITA